MKERETDRFVVLLEVLCSCTEELTVGVDGTIKAFRKPVERDIREDCIKRRVLVRPLQELLANPD